MDNTGKSKLPGFFIKLISYISVLLFFLSFNFQDSRNDGWIRQYITAPIGTAQIRDMVFTDSLTGYIVTSGDSLGQGYIIKTINGGNNWNIIKTDSSWFTHVFVLNKDTMFFTPTGSILKTTNSGINWTKILLPGYTFANGICAINSDTIWFACPLAPYLGGGLYRTTNGGQNWELQFTNISGVSGYAQTIYMYNRNIGFMGTDHGELLKTSNSGVNWTKVYTSIYTEILDICFKDSLTGYLADYEFRKTTNGGLNWQTIPFPNIPGVYYTGRDVRKISVKNDTLYTVGSYVAYLLPIYRIRGTIYKSTNGGLNWGYQLLDTSWGLGSFQFVNFINSKTGWVYNTAGQGIHTIIGGDTTFLADIKNRNAFVSNDYILYQNYPNPFNATSNIKYKIEKASNIKLIIFDISGKEIATIADKKQNPGEYQMRFDGNNLSSGIYFYSLFLDGVRVDTKKMVMVK
jgi:photosystem II stability/assembly factor-like uncharacterized protein